MADNRQLEFCARRTDKMAQGLRCDKVPWVVEQGMSLLYRNQLSHPASSSTCKAAHRMRCSAGRYRGRRLLDCLIA